MLSYSISRRMNGSLDYLQSYCVGVLQAAVLSLIQDVEPSALVVGAIGPTGNLIHVYICIYIIYVDYFVYDHQYPC